MEHSQGVQHLDQEQLRDIISAAKSDIAFHSAAMAANTIIQAAAQLRLIGLQLAEDECE